ncbi:MAG: hypothetical protein V7703_00540 [Hyphomicrobiales bacterium]
MSNDIDFTQIRPPESRWKTLAKAYTHKPKNKFGDPRYVFMHVGKTGGTSVNTFFQNCHKAGLRVPIVLNHNWSFQMARLRYPQAKIIVVLRDPLERIISGFNFRLREGRPAGHPWTANEAIVYSHFGNVGCFMDALCSDETQHISALGFCFRNINHLRRGYKFHFGDLDKEPLSTTKILRPIRIENIEGSLRNIIAELNSIQSENFPKIRKMYESSVPSETFVQNKKYINSLPIIKSRIFMEYQIYKTLEKYVSES